MHALFFVVALCPLLLIGAIVDWKTYHLPPFIWALVAAIGVIRFLYINTPAIEFLFSVLFALSVYSIGIHLLKGRMGAGDVKLLSAISLSLCFWEWAFMLFLACAIAIPFAARARSRNIGGGRIPFIPFIALGYMVIVGMTISGLSDYLTRAIGS